MSIMRYSSESKYEDVDPLYVYFSVHPKDGPPVLSGMAGATPKQYIEVVMRSLEQSGELTDEELETCHDPLRSRFDWGLEDE